MKSYIGMNRFKLTNGIYVLSALILLSACNLKEDRLSKEETEIVRQELNNRELHKISEGEIMEEARTKGGEVVRRMTDTLKTKLMTAVEQEGVAGAIQYCNVAALSLTQRLEKHINAEIVRVSSKNRNASNVPRTDLEKQLLEAYEYSANDGNLDLEPNVQILDETILYTHPIFVKEMCLKCHGEEEKDIETDNLTLLRELYPEGKATGYKANDFRGMWIVRFDKKELIKNMKVTVPSE